MAGFKFLKSSALTAIAAALSMSLIPAAAHARPDDGENPGAHGNRGGGDRGGDRGGGNGGGGRQWGGGEGRAAAQARPAPAPAPQQQQQQAQGGGWGRGGNAENRGWRGNQGGAERGAERVESNRNWQRGTPGDNGRPAGRWNGTPPQTTERAPDRSDNRWQGDRGTRGRDQGSTTWQGRNGTYSDPARNGSYRDANRDGRRDWDRDRDRRDNWRGNDRRDGDRQWSGGNYRQWNNGWRQDRRYDWRGYRNSNRDHYRAGRYYSPYRNYSYSRLSIGIRLNSLFYGQNYWLDDPWSYRLPEVYGPYRWVRYYDDVLLVDIYSGEVVDVIYDFFW